VTSEQLQASIAKIETALSRGELRVQFADRMVEYRSVEELMRALEYFKGELARMAGRRRQWNLVAGKGF